MLAAPKSARLVLMSLIAASIAVSVEVATVCADAAVVVAMLPEAPLDCNAPKVELPVDEMSPMVTEMVWAPFTPPGHDGFILGTDYLGRDLLAGILNGGRVSLTIGLVAAAMSVFIGITVGALAGYYRGFAEEILMRITEFFQVLPTLLFSMVIPLVTS